MRRRGKGKKGNKGGNSVVELMVNSAKSSTNTEIIKADIRVRRQNMNIIQTPPKNYLSQIYWVRSSIAQPNAYVTSTSTPTEVGLTFTLSSIDNGSTYAAVFDQYCIYGVTVDFSYGSANTGTGPQNVDFHSCIDYDNVAAIGLNAMTAFESYNHSVITPQGGAIVRFLFPCVATAAYNGAFTGFTTTRAWIDANSPSVIHYGLRTLFSATGVAVTLSATFSYILGFRNAHG